MRSRLRGVTVRRSAKAGCAAAWAIVVAANRNSAAARGSTYRGRKHFAAGDGVAGCEAEPRCEVFGRGPCPQIRSALAGKLERKRGAEAVNLGQICSCEAV